MLTALLAVPVELSRAEAAHAAREELAKEIYRKARPGLVERLVRWAYEQLSHLLDRVAGVSPGGYVGLVVAVLLVVAAVVAVRLKVGPLGRRSASEEPLFLGRPRTSAEHRTAADAFAARGEWAEAVRERLRAIVRSLEERSILEPRAGRTTDEAAAEAGLALPSCARDLHGAARLFDEVWYGGRPADGRSDAALRRLDASVASTRPQPTAPTTGAGGWRPAS